MIVAKFGVSRHVSTEVPKIKFCANLSRRCRADICKTDRTKRIGAFLDYANGPKSEKGR